MFPPLAAVYGALYFPRAARVDGRLLSRALRLAAERRGLRVAHGSVARLVLDQNRIAGVVVDGTAVSAPRVAIAGGAWSQVFSDQLGIPICVRPQRGRIIHLRKAGIDTTAWPIVTAFREHYTEIYFDTPRKDSVCTECGHSLTQSTRSRRLDGASRSRVSGHHRGR